MSVAAETSACPVCGGSIGVGDKECPNCHATAQWQDCARAVDLRGNRSRNGSSAASSAKGTRRRSMGFCWLDGKLSRRR